MKKTILLAAVACAALSLVSPLRAQEEPGQFGLGVYIGTPFGFSGKYNIDRNLSLDTAVGVQGDDLDAHFDVLTHFRDVHPQPSVGKVAPYLGLGIKIKDEFEALFGFRFVGGLSYVCQGAPVEIFAEIAPVLRLAPSTGSNLDGGVGLRYYFGSGGGDRSRYRVR